MACELRLAFFADRFFFFIGSPGRRRLLQHGSKSEKISQFARKIVQAYHFDGPVVGTSVGTVVGTLAGAVGTLAGTAGTVGTESGKEALIPPVPTLTGSGTLQDIHVESVHLHYQGHGNEMHTLM